MLAALAGWQKKVSRSASSDYSFHMCVSGWSRRHFEEMEQVVAKGINPFNHFVAFKGALMVTREYAMVQGVVLVIAVTFVLLSLLADVLYMVLNPRMRDAR